MKEQGKMLCQQIQRIDLEVSCTFTNHVMFHDRYGIKQQELFHVLVAFSAYDTVSIPGQRQPGPIPIVTGLGVPGIHEHPGHPS
ncbi:PREDICTED: TBC1 domain family member 28-like [Galeopterus variegatus]|uniref:TBC1 domain family member 28-like n=1 Tax=Galeopterus variegatus TaxID=482537 RepID=A0ABM0Q4I3_GALVR|nr:PREDICTED: TBC1 domain family member 28-like [Galeopterus variegatus]XP_008563444.1 PREDICTED: TBC1 domain family member 28-like [Galeopterus variegatus]